MLRQSQRPRRVSREHAECFLSIKIMWAGLAVLLQDHKRGHICDTPDVRVEHVGA